MKLNTSVDNYFIICKTCSDVSIIIPITGAGDSFTLFHRGRSEAERAQRFVPGHTANREVLGMRTTVFWLYTTLLLLSGDPPVPSTLSLFPSNVSWYWPFSFISSCIYTGEHTPANRGQSYRARGIPRLPNEDWINKEHFSEKSKKSIGEVSVGHLIQLVKIQRPQGHTLIVEDKASRRGRYSADVAQAK